MLEEDTYSLTLTGAGENASLTGDLDINDDLTIEGENGAEVIIDGDGNDGVFDVDEGVSFTLRNLTVQGGGNPAGTDPQTGGIRSFGPLTLESVTVRENHVGSPGSVGGIASNSSLTITDSFIIDNSANGEFGIAGLYAGGPTNVEDTEISDNSATGNGAVGGAALYDSDMQFTDVLFTGNSGDGDNSAGALYVEDIPLVFDNVTVSDNDASGPDDKVAGIWAYLADLTIIDSTIARNVASGAEGTGGMYAYGSQVEIQDTQIEDNAANGNFGVGGFFSDGDFLGRGRYQESNRHGRVGAAGILTPGELTLDSVDITGNTASGELGVGGLLTLGTTSEISHSVIGANEASGPETAGGFANGGPLDMTDSVVVDNETSGEDTGAGMYSFGIPTLLERVLITENSADGDFSEGGLGIDTPDLGPVGFGEPTFTMLDSTVSGNHVAGDESTAGVAIFNGYALLERVTVSGNTGPGELVAGGIYNITLTDLINVTVSGNTVGIDGAGGIYNDGDLLILFSTIVNNTSIGPNSGAGGILNDSDLQIENSIFVGNVWDGSIDNCFLDGASATSNGGNIESGDGCNFTQPTDLINTDPMIGPLANNGGYVETHALLLGSPAIDHGFGCPPPSSDARGAPRPASGVSRIAGQSGECDSGAYEFGSSPPGTATPTPEPTPEPGKYTQGDVDCDDDVDSVDALKQLRHVAGLTVPQTEPCPDIGTEVASLFGDVDCDGDVDSVDALKVLRHVASLSVSQTDPCSDIGGPLD